MSWRCIACGRLLCGCVVVGPASATPPVAGVDERQLAFDLETSHGAGGRVAPSSSARVAEDLRDASRLEARHVGRPSTTGRVAALQARRGGR